jgi:hypothetical protein
MNKKLIRLTESDLHNMVKHAVARILRENLDSDMEMWKTRSKDEFGTIIKKIEKKFINLFGEEDAGYGFKQTPLSNYITAYALDGDRAYTAKRIYNVLENYDMVNNGDKELDVLVSQMMEMASLEMANSF